MAARQRYFTGKLLDPDDFGVEQDWFAGKRGGGRFELELDEGDGLRRWLEVPDLASAEPDERVFVLDRDTGRIRFGDGEHGRRPSAGADVHARYTAAAGRAGVGARVRTAIGLALLVAGALAVRFARIARRRRRRRSRLLRRGGRRVRSL